MEPLGADDPSRIAGYRIVARLGSGGMGRVYLARSPGGRPVALKVIRDDLASDPEFRGRFAREVDAARSVSGVFTAPVLDADPRGNPAWLATGYVAGVSLQDAVVRFGPLPRAAVVTLGAGLAEALVAVHGAGLIHRDLKPANVMLAADGPKLIDFGIARAVGESTTNYTQAGSVIGSPSFLSPEQVTGTDLGPAADVFALASVLVFTLTGHRTFAGDTPVNVLYAVVNGEPDLTGVPGELLGVLHACLNKEPARRPDPGQVIRALHGLADPDDDGWQLPAPLRDAIVERSASLFGATAAPRVAAAAPPYGLGVDLGTSATCAAVWRDGRAVPVSLGARSPAVPSVVFLCEDGAVLAADAALQRGVEEPQRLARDFRSRLGDEVPLVLGGRSAAPHELAGHLLRWVLDAVAAREGAPPAQLTLTHPSDWRRHRIRLLLDAAAATGQRDVTLLSEPVAAALRYHAAAPLPVGALLAVHDLGGASFEASVVRRTEEGFELAGPPGRDGFGGADVDRAVLAHVARVVGSAWERLDANDAAVGAALERVRLAAVAAKETLSAEIEAVVPVTLPGVSTRVRITRAELEAAVHAPVQRTVELLWDAVAAAGARPEQLHAVVLAGGSGRMPIVARLVGALGVRVAADVDPLFVVCLGAATAAGARLARVDGSGSGPAAVAAGTSGEPSDGGETAAADAAVVPGRRPPPPPPGPEIAPAGVRPAEEIAPAGVGPAEIAPSGAGPAEIAPSGAGPSGAGPSGAGAARRRRRTAPIVLVAAALVVAALVPLGFLLRDRLFPAPGGPTASPVAAETFLPRSAAPVPADVVVWSAAMDGREEDVLSTKADGSGRPSRLTTDPGTDAFPALSPDRRTVVYLHRTPNGGGAETWVVAADGSGEPRRLFGTPDPECEGARPAWFAGPDPTSVDDLLAVTCRAAGRSDLRLIRVDGTAVRTLDAQGGPDDPTFSRDGRFVAYWKTAPDGTASLYRVATAGDAAPQRLTTPPAGGAGDADPVYSPVADDVIAFRRGLPGRDLALYVIDATGTRPVYDAPLNQQDPSWSPDGTQLAFKNGPDLPGDLWVVNLDGTGARLVIGNDGHDNAPAWTAR